MILQSKTSYTYTVKFDFAAIKKPKSTSSSNKKSYVSYFKQKLSDLVVTVGAGVVKRNQTTAGQHTLVSVVTYT